MSAGRGPGLHLVVRTPRAVVAELDVLSLRVPTHTGQVGIRPGGERLLTPVEPGLALARTAGPPLFLGTAGGLLRSDRRGAVLATPIAFTGEDPGAVLRAIEAALAAPDPELELRRAIGRLEAGMLRELGAAAPLATGATRRRA
jgi:F0F1-type ATP synthase epsilon subunit